MHIARFGKPGQVMVGSDSHTPAAGSLGMLAFGAGGAGAAGGGAGGLSGLYRLLGQPRLRDFAIVTHMVRGRQRVWPLGVEQFGQTGRIADLYRVHGITRDSGFPNLGALDDTPPV